MVGYIFLYLVKPDWSRNLLRMREFGSRVALNFRLAIKFFTHFIDFIIIHDMTFLDESIGILELTLRP